MKYIKGIIILLLLIVSFPAFSYSYSFATHASISFMPVVADVDGDEKNEIVVNGDNGNIYIMNAEKLKYYEKFLDSNWQPYKDIYINEKDNRIFGIKLVNTNIKATPFLFDTNGDGVRDLIFVTKNNEIISINLIKMFSDIKKNKYAQLSDYYIWTNKLNYDVSSDFSLYIKNKKYYLVAGTIDEYLLIIDIKTGNIYKKLDLSKYSILDIAKPVYDSPLIFDLNGDKILDIVVGSDSGTFYAINGRNFNLLWKFSKKNSPILFSPIVVKNKNGYFLCAAFREYKVVLLDMKTGKLKWQYNTNTQLLTAPVAGDIDKDKNDEIIIATKAGNIRCFNSISGSIIWSIETSNIVGTPILYDLNNDFVPDIIVPNERGLIEVFNLKIRKKMDKYKFVTKGLQALNTQPILGDIDNNSILDIGIHSSDGNFYMFSDPNSLSIYEGKMINNTEKGDLFRTGNIRENKKINLKLKSYLNQMKKIYFYNLAQNFLKENNITQAAINFKKVINIDPEYEDAMTTFNSIKDNFLSYEYKTFNDAIKNDNLKLAQDILAEVKNTSNDYEKIPEMEKSVKQKYDNYKEADKLYKEAVSELKARHIIKGYEKLELGLKLKPFDTKIKKMIDKYSYVMEVYRNMLKYEKEKKWRAAAEELRKLKAKNPNFPNIRSHEQKIKFNRNKFLYLAIILIIIILTIGIVLFVKKRKKLQEEIMEHNVIKEKVEVTTNTQFSHNEEQDEFEMEDIEEYSYEDEVSSTEETTAANEYEPTETENKEGNDSEEDVELWGIDLSEEGNNEEKPVKESIPVEENIEEEMPIEEKQEDALDENLEVRMNMAVQLYENGEYEKAIEAFQKIINLNKKYKYEAQAYLGFCYYEMKDLETSMDIIKSIPYKDESIPLEERIRVLKVLGKGFVRNKLYKPAISVYKKLEVLSSGIDKKEALYQLGCIYEEIDDKENAQKYFKQLFVLDSTYKDVGDKLDEIGYA